MSFTFWDFQGSISYTAQTRLEDYEHPRCRLITGLAVGKSLKILDSPIAKATQRRSSLTFYRWDLQVNLKRPLGAFTPFFWSLSSLLQHISITNCPVSCSPVQDFTFLTCLTGSSSGLDAVASIFTERRFFFF